MFYIVSVILGICICSSVVPLVQYIYLSFFTKKKKIVFYFSEELFETDYSNDFLEMKQEEFERRKQQIYSQELP